MADVPAAPGDPGKLTVTWTDGSQTTYTIPAADVAGFSHTGNQVKFRGAIGEGGVVRNFVLNFDHMKGYEKSWL